MYIKQRAQMMMRYAWLWMLVGSSLFCSSNAFANCGFSVESVIYTPATCGVSDGSAELVLNGGVQPFVFSWSNGSNTQAVTGLASGIYSVTITDANTCSVITDIIIPDNGAPSISNINASNATCQNNDGSLGFDVATGNYNISWSGAATGSLTGVAGGTINLPNLISGDYDVVVDDGSGCLAYFQGTVGQGGNITANITVSQNPTCAGGTNGIITTQATSGTLPFEFFIDGVSQGSFSASSFDFTGLSAGSYEISVVDGNGCSITEIIVVDEAGATTLDNTDFAFGNVSCPSGNDGSIVALVACPTCEVYNTQTGALVGNLAAPITTLEAGDYEIRLNTGGCISTLPFDITDPVAWQVGVVVDNPTCTAGEAFINLTVMGGLAPYTYAWSNSATTEDITNLLPNDYVVTITDNVGCAYSPDTITVDPCISTEVVTVETNGQITFCVDTNDVAGNVVSVINVCPGLVDGGVIGPIGLDGCVTYDASFLEGFDTVCVEVCGDAGGICDTTTIVFSIQSPTDTVTTFVNTNQSVTACPPLGALPGTIISATDLSCTVLQSGSVSNIDQATGCVTYDAGAQMGSDTVCIEYCDDLGFCDTAVMVFNVLSPIDTIDVFVSVNTTETSCPDITPLPGNILTVTNLNCAPLANGVLTNLDAATGCISYQATGVAGEDEICIEVCDDMGNCDTTVFEIHAIPAPDTVIITVPAGSNPIDTCPINLQYPGTLVAVTDLGCDVNTVGTVNVDLATGCVNYTPPTSVPNSGTRADTVCLVICDNSAPIAYCDTMVYIFNNEEPDCSGGIPSVIAAQITDCPTTEALVCLPIPLDSINLYSLEVDGTPYTAPFDACDVVRRLQYPISLIPPCDSTFEVTWEINGTTLGPVTVNDFAGIVAQMNLWDGNTVWSLGTNPLRIIGVTDDDNLIYGDLSISCSSNSNAPIAIGASVQSQYSQGTSIDFGGPGFYNLVVTNPLNCVDTAEVQIYCVESEEVFDTIVLGTSGIYCDFDLVDIPNADTIANACPGIGPDNVTFIVDQGTFCVEYIGDSVGTDIACIILCAPNGICDTTYLYIEVVLAAPDAVNDTFDMNYQASTTFDVCANDSFNLVDYSIVEITSPTQGTLTQNDCSFTYVVDAANFCGLDSFQYAVTNSAGSDTATVYLDVPCGPFEVFDGFSPNGDGINDFFTINSLDDYPGSVLTVFNRWGNLVYQATDYQNDWDGTFNGTALPDGTFFYILELNNAANEVYTGYIILQR